MNTRFFFFRKETGKTDFPTVVRADFFCSLFISAFPRRPLFWIDDENARQTAKQGSRWNPVELTSLCLFHWCLYCGRRRFTFLRTFKFCWAGTVVQNRPCFSRNVSMMEILCQNRPCTLCFKSRDVPLFPTRNIVPSVRYDGVDRADNGCQRVMWKCHGGSSHSSSAVASLRSPTNLTRDVDLREDSDWEDRHVGEASGSTDDVKSKIQEKSDIPQEQQMFIMVGVQLGDGGLCQMAR